MPDSSVANLAKDMISALGAEEAWTVANAKLLARLRTGKRAEAAFWAMLGGMIWTLSRESPAAAKART